MPRSSSRAKRQTDHFVASPPPAAAASKKGGGGGGRGRKKKAGKNDVVGGGAEELAAALEEESGPRHVGWITLASLAASAADGGDSATAAAASTSTSAATTTSATAAAADSAAPQQQYLGSRVRRPIPPPFQHLVQPLPPVLVSPENDPQGTVGVIMAEGTVVGYKAEGDPMGEPGGVPAAAAGSAAAGGGGGGGAEKTKTKTRFKNAHRTPALYLISYDLPPTVDSNTSQYTEALTHEELVTALASATKRLNSSLPTSTLQSIAGQVGVYNNNIVKRREECMEMVVGGVTVEGGGCFGAAASSGGGGSGSGGGGGSGAGSGDAGPGGHFVGRDVELGGKFRGVDGFVPLESSKASAKVTGDKSDKDESEGAEGAGGILPRLLLTAAAELDRERRLRAEYDRLAAKLEKIDRRSSASENGGGGGRSSRRGTKTSSAAAAANEEDGDDGGADAPPYYSSHPTSYLGGSYVPPARAAAAELALAENGEIAANNGEAGEDGAEAGGEQRGFSPANLAQRTKLGCGLAWEYVRRIHVHHAELYGTSVPDLPAAAGAAATVIEQPIRRSGRARTANVNYAEDDAGAEEDAKMKASEYEDDGTPRLPGEHEHGGRVARHLLRMLGYIKDDDDDSGGAADDDDGAVKADEDEEMEDANAEDDDDENEDEEEEEEEEDEEPTLTIDPFFVPTPYAVAEHLGRRHKSMSPAQVQGAICRAVTVGMPTPDFVLDEIRERREAAQLKARKALMLGGGSKKKKKAKSKAGKMIADDDDEEEKWMVLSCTTGDRTSDLPQFEPSSFARCRFMYRTYVPEPDEEEEEEEDDEEEGEGEEDKMDVDQVGNGAGPEAAQAASDVKTEEELEEEAKLREEEAARVEAERAEVRNAERRWRDRKAYETWRFRSVCGGGGYAVWPAWSEEVSKILAGREEESKNKAAAAMASEKEAVDSAPIAQPAAAIAPVFAADAAAAAAAPAQNAAAAATSAAVEAPPGSAAPAEATAAAAAPDSTTTATSSADQQLAQDARLAESLASAEPAAASAPLPGGIVATAASRRSRRATTTAVTNYDVTSNALSPAQLLATVHRLIVKSSKSAAAAAESSLSSSSSYSKGRRQPNPFLSVLDLKNLIVEDYETSTDQRSIRRIRSALGKLLYRFGKVGRVVVDVDGSDAVCLNALLMEHQGGGGKGRLRFRALTRVVPRTILPVHGIAVSAAAAPTKVEDGTTAQGDAAALTSSDAASAAAAAAAATKEEDGRGGGEAELKSLEEYVSSLHFVELKLRRLLLGRIRDKGPLMPDPRAVALAADEREDEIDATDARAFGSKADGDDDNSDDDEEKEEEEIEWTTSPEHPLVGRQIYRPGEGGDEDAWYRIISYTPSVPVKAQATDGQGSVPSAGATGGGGGGADDVEAGEGTVVERRIRFRAAPVQGGDERDAIVLTEGQVRAGLEAAELVEATKDEGGGGVEHPFVGKVGTRIVLTPVTGRASPAPPKAMPSAPDASGDMGAASSASTNGAGAAAADYEQGTIAGYDTVFDSNPEDDDCGFRLLILLDSDDEEEKNEQGGAASRRAFWASLSQDGTVVASLEDPTEKYGLTFHAYHPTSSAHLACKSILDLVSAHAKAGPFLEAVDPVALNIPDYFDVIKQPMDLGTMAEKLERGDYGNLPPPPATVPGQSSGVTAVEKMIKGPFITDLLLIFDNCTTFNPEGEWIHSEALALKKFAMKKVEAAIIKAETEQFKSKRAKKKSIYVDEDSDVDMYEYESDYDDEYGAAASSRTGRKRKKASKEEDNATKAIEAPVRLPTASASLHEGLLASLPVRTDARTFGLPCEWSIRPETDTEEDVEDNNKVGAKAYEEERKKQLEAERERLVLLEMQLQQETGHNLRRSTRAATAVAHGGNEAEGEGEKDRTAKNAAMEGIEYYLPQGEGKAEVAKDRVGVESVRESLHETHYSDLYYQRCVGGAGEGGGTSSQVLAEQAGTILDSNGVPKDYGTYSSGSFPPYLGRIVPANSGAKSDGNDDVVWEIRRPYLNSALRWVIRGLVRSGHLGEVEPIDIIGSSEGLYSNSPGSVILNNEYYFSESIKPYDVLDVKELQRRRRAENMQESEESEEEVELSAYEKMRAERVARNQERLKALGLA